MKVWKLSFPCSTSHCLSPGYAFRPERLVVNKRVHEEFPTAQGSSPDQTLASGTFHAVLHPTGGTATFYRIGMAVAFFASRTSRRRTALAFTSTFCGVRQAFTTQTSLSLMAARNAWRFAYVMIFSNHFTKARAFVLVNRPDG
jgi:hypothetical protein